MVNLTESDIKLLIIKSKEIFSKQPIYLELEAPITILGMNITKLLFKTFRRHTWSIF